MDDLVFAALGAALDLVEGESFATFCHTSLARALCREMPRVRSQRSPETHSISTTAASEPRNSGG